MNQERVCWEARHADRLSPGRRPAGRHLRTRSGLSERACRVAGRQLHPGDGGPPVAAVHARRQLRPRRGSGRRSARDRGGNFQPRFDDELPTGRDLVRRYRAEVGRIRRFTSCCGRSATWPGACLPLPAVVPRPVPGTPDAVQEPGAADPVAVSERPTSGARVLPGGRPGSGSAGNVRLAQGEPDRGGGRGVKGPSQHDLPRGYALTKGIYCLHVCRELAALTRSG